MAWKEIKGGDVIRLEVGESIEGKLLAVRQGEFAKVYDIETKDGKKTLFGSAVLDSRMAEVKVGDRVKIERLEDELPKVKGHNPTKMYRVFVEE